MTWCCHLDFVDGNLEREGALAWYCLVGVLAIVMCAVMTCACRDLYERHRNQQLAAHIEAEEAAFRQVDAALSRMEANVKLYSEQEQFRRRKVIQRATRSCTMVRVIVSHTAEHTSISKGVTFTHQWSDIFPGRVERRSDHGWGRQKQGRCR
jgi:hypothetical protein